jgi:hypothetical protein
MFRPHPMMTVPHFSLPVQITSRQASPKLHSTENSKQIFPEMKLRGLVPNFHIRVFVSDLHIPTIGPPIFLVDRSWEYINRSQIHECGTWERGRAVSFLRIVADDLSH